MKQNILWIILYSLMVILLAVTTTLDFEEHILKDWHMTILDVILYSLFMLGWIKLMNTIHKNHTVHKWLFALLTWCTLLTIGEILFVQYEVILAMNVAMLVITAIAIAFNRQNNIVVDGLMAGAVFIVLYAAMQFDPTVIPGGVLGALAITFVFIIIGSLFNLSVTTWLSRGIFLIFAGFILLLEMALPITEEYSYFVYLLFALFVVFYFIGRKRPMLFPQKWMLPFVAITLIVFVVRLFH